MAEAPLPAVVIVGRPNVGKSTLFNRLTRRRAALVHDLPGVTRDRKEAEADLFGLRMRLIDTAGFEDAKPGAIEARMVEQTRRAVAGADAILFMIDGRAGVVPLDRGLAAMLRASGKPIVLAANKCEAKSGETGRLDAYSLGLGEPLSISAEHALGMADLHEALLAVLPGAGAPAEDDENAAAAEAEKRPMTLAIVGQPNAGKSTLMNRLLGEERVIVGPEPGLTRDSIAIDWSWHGRPIKLVDTAGLRRRAKIEGALEKLAAGDAIQAIRFADAVVLLVDALTVRDFGAGLEKQDLQIARHAEEEGRALVVAANKWDMVENGNKLRGLIEESLENSLAQLKGVPLVTISALDGTGLERLMREVVKTYDAWNMRVTTARLNRWLEAALEANPPPLVRGRRLKIRYMTQAKARPPTFAFFANMPGDMPESYMRYLANGLRQTFGFAGVPLRLNVRGGANPFDK